jgi:enoyl-CoA hydratase
MLHALKPVTALRAPLAILLRGEGGKAFCAGGDVRGIAGSRGALPSQLAFFREEYLLDGALARHGNAVVPHVALWDGIVMGGGVGISLHAPFRVATRRTLFAMPEAAIGIFPDVGGSFALPRLRAPAGSPPLPPGWGLYLGLTGARLSGADAVHGGLATHFVEDAALPALEGALAALPPADGPLSGAAAFSRRAAAVRAALDAVALPPAALPPFSLGEGARAALGRAFGGGGGGGAPPPAGRGAAVAALRGIFERLGDEAARGGEGGAAAGAALAALRAASPTSLLVAVEAQARCGGAGATLGGALAMELRLMRALLQRGDFYEGVRAVLTDKGKGAPPAWAPPPATDAEVAALFEGGEGGPLEGEELLRAMGDHLANAEG